MYRSIVQAVLFEPFRWLARQGRYVLIAGIIAGLVFESLAQSLRFYIPHMAAGLLFLSMFGIGPARLLASLRDWPRYLTRVLVLQLAVPLGVLASFGMLGLLGNIYVVALILICAAPSISGSPNMMTMMGYEPTPAMCTMILGTALLPLTVFPVLIFMPALGDPAAVLLAALKLLAVIVASSLSAFGLRHLFPEPDAQVVEGVSAVLQAIIVIGLMAAVRPAIVNLFWVFAIWMAFVFVVNFGMQAMAYRLSTHEEPATQAALTVISGNRNIALFLVALPEAVTTPLLIFIGCYQIPMYLTPLVVGYFLKGKRA
ncbi:MAG: hypothetical protein ABJ327_15655 [Litoreibacter sp.]